MNHGDIVETARLFIRPRNSNEVAFSYQSLVHPHIVDESKRAVDKCQAMERCIALPKLVIVEPTDTLIALPGGQARSEYISFALTRGECEGAKADCSRFGNFDDTIRALAGQSLPVF